MIRIVGVKFKENGKVYHFDPADLPLSAGMHVIVETARGLEYGEVSMSNTQVSESDIVPPLRPLVRIATEADDAHNAENKKKEQPL